MAHGGRQFGPCPGAGCGGAGGPLCRLCAQLRQQGERQLGARALAVGGRDADLRAAGRHVLERLARARGGERPA